MAELTPQQKTELTSASRNSIAVAWSRMDVYRRRQIWVGVTNRYRQSTVSRVNIDWVGGSFNQRNLPEYLAAAVFLHCLDGWSYLGRALSAHLGGDEPAARHLGYYAELRAAISLLASQGVGIFNRRHVVMDAQGNAQRISGEPGTHLITWLALEHWSKKPDCGALLSRVITPGGIPIDEWLAALRLRLPWRALGGTWTRSWGLDLERLSEDRDLRNESSYRPSRLLGERSMNGTSSVEFAHSLWAMFEPWPNSPFEIADRYLLRWSIEETWSRRRQEPIGSAEYIAEIRRVLSDLDPAGAGNIEDFLLRANGTEAALSIFELAAKHTSMEISGQHTEVLARAALLLRISTGAAIQVLLEDPTDPEELAYWWDAIAEDMGYWDQGNRPASMADLWADVADALDETSNPTPAARTVFAPVAASLQRFSECERIALWALAS